MLWSTGPQGDPNSIGHLMAPDGHGRPTSPVCGISTELSWFPERVEDLRPAKQVCRGCLVREEWLAYALEKRDKVDIWGGMSERERRQLRKTARAVAA